MLASILLGSTTEEGYQYKGLGSNTCTERILRMLHNFGKKCHIKNLNRCILYRRLRCSDNTKIYYFVTSMRKQTPNGSSLFKLDI